MKIEVWSDFVCPFCYIGKRRLEEAIAQFPGKDQVEVEFKSFELDPNAKPYSGTGINEALAKKYGMSIEEAKRANEGIGSQAAGVGLQFNFDDMKPTNTFDAHRLAKFAATVGKEKEMTEKLLASYFTESKLISDHDVLVEIAQSAGIEKAETLAVLNDSTKYANDVRIDEALAQQMGVTGVPFLLLIKSILSQAHSRLKHSNVLFSKFGKKKETHLNCKTFQEEMQEQLAQMITVKFLKNNRPKVI